MKTKVRDSSRILEAVHETAEDLHRASFIDVQRMRHFDALCLDPIPPYTSENIRTLATEFVSWLLVNPFTSKERFTTKSTKTHEEKQSRRNELR